MRRTLTLALSLAVLLSAGCSSHEPRFEASAPPAPARGPSEELVDATARLIAVPTVRLVQLSPEALAALTTAAAVTYRSTAAPRARTLAGRYADALLEARVELGEGLTGYFSEQRPGPADPGMTATAGLALLDAWHATRDRRYADAVREAVVAVTSEELGWTAAGSEAAVRRREIPRGRSISLTANAFLLLGRADRELGTETADEATLAFNTVNRNQAAVGRWYATVGPPRSPMNLSQWATTLYALTSSKRQEAQGIAAAGVPAMYEAAFDDIGRVLDAPLTREDPAAVAKALSVLTQYTDTRLADAAFARVLNRLRPDGTVDLAASGDLTAQALFGLAFARRQAALRLADARG